MADRAATDQRSLWSRLVNSPRTGMENLRVALGTDPVALARDWAVSVYADDAVSGVPPIYQQPSWNFRSIFQILTPSGYPLKVRTFANGSTSVTLTPGGSSYLRVAPTGTGVASVTFRSGGAAPPPEFSVFVIRTK